MKLFIPQLFSSTCKSLTIIFTIAIWSLFGLLLSSCEDRISIKVGQKPAEKKLPASCEMFLSEFQNCTAKSIPNKDVQEQVKQFVMSKRAQWQSVPYDRMDKSCQQMLQAYKDETHHLGC